MSARKIEDITIFSDERYYCGPGPAVVAFPNGELIVFFRRHRSWTSEPFFTHVHPTTGMCMTRSTEGGKRWSLPRVIVAGGQCAGATLLKDGRMLCTTHRSEPVPVELAAGPPNQPNDGVPEMFRRRPRQWGGVAAGTEMWLSADRGETWDGPNWLGEMPGVPPLVRGLHTPVQHRGFPVELSNGDIAMTVQAAPGSIFYISENRGRTWRFRAIAAPHLAEDKQFIVVAPVLESTQGILPVIPKYWFKDLEQDEKAILAVIDEMCAKYRIDENSIMLHGFSAGGFPLYYTGLRNPARFDMVIARGCNCRADLLERVEITDEARKLPIMILCGKDDNVFIQKQSWLAYRYLRERRCFATQRKEFAGGHLRRPDLAYQYWRDVLPARHKR